MLNNSNGGLVKKIVNKIELVSFIFCILFQFLGTFLPTVFGVKGGPNEIFSIRFDYRSGPVYIEPWMDWVVSFCLFVAGVCLFVLLVTFVLFDILKLDVKAFNNKKL